MTKKLKIGLIGADSAGKSWGAIAHIPAIQNIDTIELEALCNSSPESAITAGKFYGIERVYHNVNDLLKQSDIDIITVVVSIPNHYEMVKSALKAGKHVYCEWPLTANFDKTKELSELAKSKKVVTAIGLQGQHDPSLNYIKVLNENGWFGEILSIQMTHMTRGSTTKPSRAVWESEIDKGAHLLNIVGGHTINYIIYCFGSIKELSAKISIQNDVITFADTGETEISNIPDTILIHGEMSNGASLFVNISAVPYHSEGWKLRINGTKGTIIAKSDILPQISPITLVGSQGTNELREMEVPRDFYVEMKSDLIGPPRNIAQAYSKMADAIDGGKSYSPNFSDAVKMEMLLDIIKQSSEQKRTIEIDQFLWK